MDFETLEEFYNVYSYENPNCIPVLRKSLVEKLQNEHCDLERNFSCNRCLHHNYDDTYSGSNAVRVIDAPHPLSQTRIEANIKYVKDHLKKIIQHNERCNCYCNIYKNIGPRLQPGPEAEIEEVPAP